MAQIVVASSAGACYGVERALTLVRRAAQAAPGKVTTLGPLIHNPQVVQELEAEGVSVTDEVPESKDTVLVLRTHGVEPAIEKQAHDRGLTVVDAVCPYVTKSHRAARKLYEEGYQVIVVGEAGHPEVVATCAHAPGSLVVGSLEELNHIQLAHRVGMVVQTTQSQRLLTSITAELVGRVDELRVMNTICEATGQRQRAAAALARTADCMVVIGGRNSANTTRLAEICAELCPSTHHIETADELESEWFCNQSLIGVTAGASTPSSQIDAVVHAIAALAP